MGFRHSTVEDWASLPPAFQRTSEILVRLEDALWVAVILLLPTARLADVPQPVVTALTRCRHQRDDQERMGGRQSSPGRSLVTAGLPCRKGMCVAIGHSCRGTATLTDSCVAKPMEPSLILLETQRAVFAAAGRTVMRVEIDARWSPRARPETGWPPECLPRR